MDPVAIISLVCGVLGLLFFCCCSMLTMFLAPIALIFGGWSVVRIRNHPQTYSGAGLAWAGAGTGLAGCMLLVLFLGLYCVAMLVEALGQM